MAGVVIGALPQFSVGVELGQGVAHDVVGVTGDAVLGVGDGEDVAVAVVRIPGDGVCSVGIAFTGLADALVVGVVGVFGRALFGQAHGFYCFEQVAFAVVAVLGGAAVFVDVLGDVTIGRVVLVADAAGVGIHHFGDVVPLIFGDGGVEAAGIGVGGDAVGGVDALSGDGNAVDITAQEFAAATILG